MAQLEMSAGDLAIKVQSWNAPVITAGAPVGRMNRSPGDMQGAEKRIYHEAEAAGRAAGLEAARADIEARARRMDEATRGLEAVLQALSRPMAHLDDEIHGQIVMLATALTRALLRRELRTDPAQIIGIVRETVSLLPASARGVRVLLHPEDGALVRQLLSTAGPDPAWSIVDDPVLSRGDCRVHTEYAQIDARVETRLQEAMAQLLGDERAAHRKEGEA